MPLPSAYSNNNQTDSAAHQKERCTKSVRANGWMSSGVAVELSGRALTRRLMRWLRYHGTDVFGVLYVNTDTYCSQFCIEPAASVVDASAVWHGVSGGDLMRSLSPSTFTPSAPPYIFTCCS